MKKEIIFFELLDGKKIPIKFIKNKKKKFIAQSPPFFGKIMVDELFFNEFSESQRISIIYHELWHKENNLKFELKYRTKKPWLWLLFFINKPIYHAQELEADLHALKMTNEKDTLNMLIRLKEMIKKGIIKKNHERTHPPIDERIKRIKNGKKEN